MKTLFEKVMVGDIVIAIDEYNHDYVEHLVKIIDIEKDVECITKSNPHGYVLYGHDLDGEDADDAVNTVYESNFVGIADNQSETPKSKARRYLESVAESEWHDIVEDSYEYENGLLLIEYDSEAALRGFTDGEISHTCVNVDNPMFTTTDY